MPAGSPPPLVGGMLMVATTVPPVSSITDTDFPAESVKSEYFTPTDHSTHCPWKGDSSYYDITVDGETKSNAAWYYPAPKDKAAEIKDHVAFYNVVTVS